MKSLHLWHGRWAAATLEGGGRLEGLVCEMGDDVLALRLLSSGRHVYIPYVQVKELSLLPLPEPQTLAVSEPLEHPYQLSEERMTYRKMLLAAKGSFSEIRLSSKRQLHGYLAGIMNDFIIFNAPMKGAVLVPLGKLRCLSPYEDGLAPYRLTPEQFPLLPLSLGLSRSFSQQLAKLQGEFVVVGRGELPDLPGVLVAAEGQMLLMRDAAGSSISLHYSAVEALHL